MTAHNDNNVARQQRLAPLARAALYAVGLLGSALLVDWLWETPSLWVMLPAGLLILGLGYMLLADACKQCLHYINQSHSAQIIHPRLVHLSCVLLLSLPALCWVLLLYVVPWHDTPQLLRIALLGSSYLTAALAVLLLLNQWAQYKDSDRKRRSAPLLNALFLAALLTMAGCFGLQRYNQLQTRQAEAALDDRADLLLDLMENSVRVHLHNNRYMPPRLYEAYEALANIEQVVGARLYTQAGQVIVEAWPFDHDSPFDEGLYNREDILLQTRSAQLDLASHPLGMGMRGGRGMRGGPGAGAGTGAGGGQGPQAWEPFPPGPHQLLIALDKSAILENIAVIHRNTLFGLLGLGLIALSVVGLGWSRHRRMDLESSLVVAQEQAAHLERLAQMGAGLAHETKNPLGIVRGLAQSINDSEPQNTTVRRYAQDIVDESDRIVGQINRFLKLARPETPRMERIALPAFLGKLKQLIQQESSDRQIALHVESAISQVEADPEQLRQVLLNLLLNAFSACGPGDAITVRCEAADPSPQQDAVLHVMDTGCGIAPEDLDKVRQPYFTRFPGGTGLGLALVEEIARNHGWRITIDSEPGKGTMVSIHGLKTVR